MSVFIYGIEQRYFNYRVRTSIQPSAIWRAAICVRCRTVTNVNAVFTSVTDRTTMVGFMRGR
jgi:hypothetical protein